MTELEALTAEQTRDLSADSPKARGVGLRRLLIGPGPAGLGLQVVTADWKGVGAPISEARSLHSERLGKKIFPLVVALADGQDSVWVMGPSSDGSPVGPIPESQAVRILQAGLSEPSGIKGRQRIAHLLRSFASTEIAGMTNSGLFATHFLVEGARQTPDWADTSTEAMEWLGLRGEQLISAMGFSARRAANAAHILSVVGSNEARAVAVLLSQRESFDASSDRFAVSPVAFGLNLAQREGADWLIVLRGPQIRLYPSKPGVGVGSRGLTETYFELDLALLAEKHAGFLGLAFSAQALDHQGSVQLLLEGSSRYATGLGERLRERVYIEVIPSLAVAVAGQLEQKGETDLDLAYRITLRILFRLLFQAYAEDRGLLPYNRNERYTRNSLKRWAQDFVEQPKLADELDVESHAIWDDLQQVWDVIDTGNRTWDVPPYNGGLFGSDPDLQPEGALIAALEIDDSIVGAALRHLLVDTTQDGTLGPVDFRSLSVREFGTVYEGLLESSLSQTDVPLTLDKKSSYIPARNGDPVVVPADGVYYHNKSGERKATGSYFTPAFAVAHLLEHSLEPSLQRHLDIVAALAEKGDTAGAEERFFDFRVADLAMGSGHFLVAAIDTIEAGMSAFLTEHNLPGITNELRRLEEAARKALGDDEADYEIEPSALLRRQIARRCIYGIDINQIAVELARVGIWIHTFIPGLPMSSLDHTLVCANSLTGIGTVEEAIEALEPDRKPGQPSMITLEIESELEDAKKILTDIANTSEATKAEVQAAAQAHRQAQEEAATVKEILDAAVAARAGMLGDLKRVPVDEIRHLAEKEATTDEVAKLQPGHMPYLFPEVFLRENPGFDCLLGNPPWEELMADQLGFWSLRFPGLKGMKSGERENSIAQLEKDRPDLLDEFEDQKTTTETMRDVIASGSYPGIGSGDIDLYQAFAWRFWHLLRPGGFAGLVLPRGALSGSGSTEWRRAILDEGSFVDVCFLHNKGRWVFDMDERKTLALVTLSKGTGDLVAFEGPFSSFEEYLEDHGDRTQTTTAEFRTWSPVFAFPTVPGRRAGEILQHMRRYPSLSGTTGFRFKPHRELDATGDKALLSFEPNSGELSIRVLTGASFNLWNPDFGDPYAFADRDALLARLLAKAIRSARSSRSAFHGLGITGTDDLPSAKARIAFRDIATRTNQRSAIFCLVPPDSALVNKAPYLLRRHGDEKDEAYLLGVACSIPFDWYVRRWVETSLNFFILEPIPIPCPDISDPRRLRVIELAGRLAAVDDRFKDWAAAVGVPFGTLKTDPDRTEATTEIDALVAHLYGLSWDQVEHVFETFHSGWDYSVRLAGVKAHYEAWEERRHELT